MVDDWSDDPTLPDAGTVDIFAEWDDGPTLVLEDADVDAMDAAAAAQGSEACRAARVAALGAFADAMLDAGHPADAVGRCLGAAIDALDRRGHPP